MPRFPNLTPMVQAMPGGVFSKVAHRFASLQGEVYPLHVGDTWMEPVDGARMENIGVEEHPGMHKYSRPHGHPALLDAIATRRAVGTDRVLVTAGATGGLRGMTAALVNPGEEVMILSPFWPLIRGIVASNHGTPVEAPFYGRDGTVAERLTPYLSERTVALYLNTPSNPTGKVLDESTMKALADFAVTHGLWIWSDEVYESYAYSRPHRSMLEFAPERTFLVQSFSKAYGMAGNRCGYVIGPSNPEALAEVRKITTHTYFSATTASQLGAARALERGDDWVSSAKQMYRDAGYAAADALGVDRPEGGTFLFLDVSKYLDERGVDGFLWDCLDHNLILAPGGSCGHDFPNYVRLCFTSAPPDVVGRGVTKLAAMLGQR